MSIKVKFMPLNIEVSASKGENLARIAHRAGIRLNTVCGGQGTCGKCKVLVTKGPLKGSRLACQTEAVEDLTVEIIDAIKDSQNIKAAVKLPENFAPDLLNRDEYNGDVPYGLALDIGTTTVVGLLWNLSEGSLVATSSGANPQRDYGADVISRITFCNKNPENIKILQKEIINFINHMLVDFKHEYSIDPESIVKILVVANTTMSHMLLGKNPKGLAIAPFSPAFNGPVTLNAKDLDIKTCPLSKVYVLPNIAGHVGSDIVAGLIYTGIKDIEGLSLVIDVGTNGEILLAKDGRVLTCSTAAGPAFEGASIKYGMRASHGAIEGVAISESGPELLVIGGTKPTGICGSGLIDCVSELLRNQIIKKNGKLITREEAIAMGKSDEISRRLVKQDGINSFILYYGEDGNNVSLTQKDIREVQMAKGAIAAGIEILMEELKIEAGDINRILLAGAFGNYINKESAKRIGLFPPLNEDKIISIGNAAGAGASMALLSKAAMEKAIALSKDVVHIELASHKSFQGLFLNAMYF